MNFRCCSTRFNFCRTDVPGTDLPAIGRTPHPRLPSFVAIAALAIVAAVSFTPPLHAEPRYPWLETSRFANRTGASPSAAANGSSTLAARLSPPPGFRRGPAAANSFATWLRGLPLKPPAAPVMYFDGRRKPRQDIHAAVIDIDVGGRDLQQCADAAMRLRAEYLWSVGRRNAIGFNYTGGGRVDLKRWSAGWRPNTKGTSWRRRAKPDASYAAFRKYLIQIFAYAGTYSLSKELASVPASDIQIGDLYLQGGFPGHAVLVVDLAIEPKTLERRMLLAQSFMPAQDMHILRNVVTPDTAWYRVPKDGSLQTPEWTFPADSLMRWSDE